MRATPFLFSDDEMARLRDKIEVAGFAAAAPPALTVDLHEAILAEADAQRPSGWGRPTGRAVDHDAWRAELGPVARDFLGSAATRRLVEHAVGALVEPSWNASCFTYYDGPTSFLGRHRDRADSCAYTLILYLRADWPDGAAPGDGLTLHVYDSEEDTPALRIETRPNMLVLGRGAEVWHKRPMLAEGEHVVALTACFARADVHGSRERASSRHRAAILAREGMTAWEGGDQAEALDRFDAAVALDPESDAAWAGRGFVFWTRRRFEEALAHFTEAVRRDGTIVSHWSNIGLCLRDLGRPDRAIGAFAAALAIDPGYAPALNEWGNVLQDLGRWSEALDFYIQALALDPSRAVVHHNLGVALLALEEKALALQAFLAALRRDPRYAHSLEEIGILLADAGQLEAARDFLTRAGSDRAVELQKHLNC